MTSGLVRGAVMCGLLTGWGVNKKSSFGVEQINFSFPGLISGFWFCIYELCFLVSSLRFMVFGLWFLISGFYFIAQGVSGLWFLASGFWYTVYVFWVLDS